MLKKLLKQMEWVYDYHILYFMYNEHKLDRYHSYMKNKWKGYAAPQ